MQDSFSACRNHQIYTKRPAPKGGPKDRMREHGRLIIAPTSLYRHSGHDKSCPYRLGSMEPALIYAISTLHSFFSFPGVVPSYFLKARDMVSTLL